MNRVANLSALDRLVPYPDICTYHARFRSRLVAAPEDRSHCCDLLVFVRMFLGVFQWTNCVCQHQISQVISMVGVVVVEKQDF